MEEMPVQLPLPASFNIPAEITANSTIVEEGPRLCPLCNSIIKLFFINFHEKMLMCENTDCEFPFGYEDLQFFPIEDPAMDDTELMSQRSIVSRRTRGSPSLALSQEWKAIGKLNHACRNEDTRSNFSVQSSKLPMEEIIKRRKAKETEEKLKKDVEQIKQLNKVLYTKDNVNITNEEWIKTLLKMQENSGLQLLKEQELQKVKKQEQPIHAGELKIDINSPSDSVASIKIDIVS